MQIKIRLEFSLGGNPPLEHTMKKHSKYKIYLNFKLFKLKISSFLNRFIFYIFAAKTKSTLIKSLFLIKFL
ncbi:hypothetical protein F1L49_03750 [Campylobacter jejuni]|nr:hypothetical protein [Campylobacter jejuni]